LTILSETKLQACKEANPALYLLLAHTVRFATETDMIVQRSQVCFEEDFAANTSFGVTFEFEETEQEAEAMVRVLFCFMFPSELISNLC
jgi:hypothetical protein